MRNRLQDVLADPWIVPVIQGYVQIEHFHLNLASSDPLRDGAMQTEDDEEVEGQRVSYKVCLVSRRSRHRAGMNRTGREGRGGKRTGTKRTGQDKTGTNRTGQDRIGQDRYELNRTGQIRIDRLVDSSRGDSSQ